jgi:RNA polymerase sigma factor (sigma-70 family)
MASLPLRRVVEHLRRESLLPAASRRSDAALLEAFLARREEAAFDALVRRHGPMVLGVCRRILHDRHSAEDAFQATFLVFLQKASSIAQREHLANWLYGVALRTSLQARQQAARRRLKESKVTEMAHQPSEADEAIQELLPFLDLEMNRLPEKYRVPILLCDLQGKSRKEAAQELKLPEGTVSTRLARARAMLAKKLARYGRLLSGSALALAVAQNQAAASVPSALLASTVKAGLLFAAGQKVAAALSIKVVALTDKVVKMMLLSKLLNALTVLVVVAVLGSSVGTVSCLALATNSVVTKPGSQGQIADPNPLGKEGKTPKQRKTEKRSGHLQIEGIDLAKGTITGNVIHTNPERTMFSYVGGVWELLVGPTTKITIDGKKALLAGLQNIKPHPDDKGWMKIVFVEWEFEVVKEDKHQVQKGKALRLEATGVLVRGILQTINGGQSTITAKRISSGIGGDFTEDNDIDFKVAKEAEVIIDGKAAKLTDLKSNMKVSLQMSALKELVLGIQAYGATVEGVLKSVDVKKNTVSVHIPSAQMTAAGVAVADDARVVLAGKEGKLSDLKAGMQVTLQMAADPERSLIIAVTVKKVGKKA